MVSLWKISIEIKHKKVENCPFFCLKNDSKDEKIFKILADEFSVDLQHTGGNTYVVHFCDRMCV